MDSQKVRELISEDQRQWQMLVAVLDAHKDRVLHTPPGSPWDSRDVYSHLSRWLEHSNRDMQAYINGHNLSPPIGNPEELNALWQMEDSHLSFEEARQKALHAFEERLRVLRAIPLEKWDYKMKKIAAYDGAEHYKAHRQYVKLD